jgi:hypothetical protein
MHKPVGLLVLGFLQAQDRFYWPRAPDHRLISKTVNIVADPSCRCGANREDSYHFFFDCSHYANMRYTLFHNLSWLPNGCPIDLKLLTSGNPILSNEQNEIIIKHMFEYIKRSERFLV